MSKIQDPAALTQIYQAALQAQKERQVPEQSSNGQ
jgi:hypothetical protein